ncbi:FAD-dependent monooxygenase [Acuticoccus sp. M5D2P5]|uniref:FAD-dependent monooxygenase n=1 Tax=Acuticoccus kalidii TaxID=2910977 RepID=UPI001F1AF649|nr:FAD-dependent monooxygenase [Acuticoccus kalidii]MCF3935601.1 FAD-dependent monooxygenase [Acuticoccus kalidii]
MIIVVGAGIAGLSAALALSDLDEILVLERRAAEAANSGAGIQLAPNAMKALQAIGAADRVAAAANRPDGLCVRAAGSPRPLSLLDYRSTMEARYGAPYLTAARAPLHGALLAEAAARPSITIRYDWRSTRLAADGDGWRVDGIDTPAALIVAADGVNSALRESLVGDTARPTGWIAWRGKGRTRPGNETELVLADDHHVVRYALSTENDNCVLVAHERQRGPDALAKTRSGAHLRDVTDWMAWPMSVRQRHIYRAGKVAFIGDAAHAMLPFLAQGGAMAIEDAAVLRAAITTHGVGETALAAYEAAREPRTRRLAAQTVNQGRIYHLPAPLSLARDLAMRRLGAEGILSRVDWIYRWAPPAPGAV